MSSLAFTQLRMGKEEECQSDTSRQYSQNAHIPRTKGEEDGKNNGAKTKAGLFETHSYSKRPGDTHALNTFVDMALALQENIDRRNDHTYALKNMRHQMRNEDIDPLYRKKDHTYASNTIGFRYSSHRGVHAQPRKSASEENLVVKSSASVSNDTSARKCTSTEEFVIISDESQTSTKLTDQNFQTHGSNAATLPRLKTKSYDQPIYPEHRDSYYQAHTSTRPNTETSQENRSNCDNDSVMEAPVKCDHTYAKFSEMAKCASLLKDDHMMSLLSSSAPGKLDRSELDRVFHIGHADHTYDKLSSAKIKDIYEEHIFYKSFRTLGKTPNPSQAGLFNKDNVNIAAENSSCSIAMDWQPQEHGQSFERRFLPIDHTYTTVS